MKYSYILNTLFDRANKCWIIPSYVKHHKLLDTTWTNRKTNGIPIVAICWVNTPQNLLSNIKELTWHNIIWC